MSYVFSPPREENPVERNNADIQFQKEGIIDNRSSVTFSLQVYLHAPVVHDENVCRTN